MDFGHPSEKDDLTLSEGQETFLRRFLGTKI